MAFKRSRFFRDYLGVSLICISSLLFGIWAVKGTIALRSVLLSIGAILSVVYIVINSYERPYKNKWDLKNSLPLFMLGLMFVWVVGHYFFLSRNPGQQFLELTSTWLRAVLASCLAIGTALSIAKKPHLVIMLWVAIFVSFLVLLWQYIPRAYDAKNLHSVDWFGGSYLYHGKINGVLAGTIMVSGLTGSLFFYKNRSFIFAAIFSIAGVLLSSYAYVYIFDARNGVGLEVLIGLAAFLFLGLTFISTKARPKSNIVIGGEKVSLLGRLLLITSLAILVAYFGVQQAKHNFGWRTTINDVMVGIQINENQQWRNPQLFGYPKSDAGLVVSSNTYERVAWATAGIMIFIPENPFGVGVIKYAFPSLLNEKYGSNVNDIVPATHSAWIDLTISYGIPGLLLLMGPLLLILYRSVANRRQYPLSGLMFMLSLALLLIYTVGELSAGHGLEILVYWIAFLGGLQFGSQAPLNGSGWRQ